MLGEEFYNILSIERFVGTELRLKKDDEKRKIYGKEMTKLYYGCTEPSKTNIQGYLEVSIFAILDLSKSHTFHSSLFQIFISGMESTEQYFPVTTLTPMERLLSIVLITSIRK
jgi:hypothetical protein